MTGKSKDVKEAGVPPSRQTGQAESGKTPAGGEGEAANDPPEKSGDDEDSKTARIRPDTCPEEDAAS